MKRITLIILLLSFFGSVRAQTSPKKLLNYYNWPTQLGTVAQAAQIFGAYDYLILGDNLQIPAHGDHLNTKAILSQASIANTKVYGYIDLGVRRDDTVKTHNHSMAEVKKRMNQWKAIGTVVKGVFLDDFGYDYYVSRSRQNEAVAYAHSIGLSVIANGWNPDDVFGTDYNATYNPSQVGTQLNSNDFYLSESYLIMLNDYQNPAEWKYKADLLKNYQNSIGFKILSVTTTTATGAYSASKFHYAWYGAALYNHEAIGWGEHYFGASQPSAPLRARPTTVPTGVFTGNVQVAGSEYYRNTSTGKVYINTSSKAYGFAPFSSVCMSNVAVGNWSSPSSWTCGFVPTSTTDVIIRAGHKITVDINASCRKFTVEKGAVFQGNTVFLSKP